MSESALPERIGPYVITRQLGAGGMGTVFLGTHADSGQVAAIKVLSASMGRDAGLVERFTREIETMSRLGGLHIVKVFDSGTDLTTGLLYYSMEYVDGQTLTDLIRARRKIPWDETVDLALQICSALRVAHAAGVVHRDLKPSNLLIGKDGIVRLTDFGVAQVFAADRLTITGGIVGTIEYMSPEQAEGRRATKKSDLYSLGAVMYAMLAGRPPFTGTSTVDVMRKHATARFDLPSLYQPEMPRLLEEVVVKLLAKNPDDRYSDAHVVSLRLKEVVQRVALAQQDESEGAARRPVNMEAPTAVAHASSTDEEMQETRDAVPRGPGPATLMRNLFQQEIDRERQRSALAKFFDHTGVLVTLFAVLVGLTGWWLLSPRGASTTDETETATNGDSNDGESEVARVMRLARNIRRTGDVAREEQTLVALKTLLSGSTLEADVIEKIDSRLSELRQRRTQQSGDYRLARESLARAKRLLSDEHPAEARAVLEAIITLYEHDLGAAEVVSEAKQSLHLGVR